MIKRYVLLALLLVAPSPAIAQLPRPERPLAAPDPDLLRQVGLDQRLEALLPLDVPFTDDRGESTSLRQAIRHRPALLVPLQLRCTMLCAAEIQALMPALRELGLVVGRDFDVVVVSIDPRETPALAAEYRRSLLRQYGRPGSDAGWHVLTGPEESIRRLTAAVGFRYVYDAPRDQFVHPDAVIVVTPAGRVARYFFRLNYPTRDLRLALVEAAAGRIGTPLDRLALLCYRYDPAAGRYTFAVLGALRIAAALTVAALVALVLGLRWRVAPPSGATR